MTKIDILIWIVSFSLSFLIVFMHSRLKKEAAATKELNRKLDYLIRFLESVEQRKYISERISREKAVK